MLKRFELHNHTTHSDAQISCRDLAEHMEKDGVDVLALTDKGSRTGTRKKNWRLPSGAAAPGYPGG